MMGTGDEGEAEAPRTPVLGALAWMRCGAT